MNRTLVYIDSSAVVKLIQEEDETAALSTWIDTREPRAMLLSSRLLLTEMLRALAHVGAKPDDVDAAEAAVVGRVTLIHPTVDLWSTAGRLLGLTLRSLDAVHLATASMLMPALQAVLTYDKRQAAAAGALGLSVESPSS